MKKELPQKSLKPESERQIRVKHVAMKCRLRQELDFRSELIENKKLMLVADKKIRKLSSL